MAQLRGPGGDAESGLHDWLVLTERHHSAARYPDGQVWTAPNSPDGQVVLIQIVTRGRECAHVQGGFVKKYNCYK